VNFRQLAVLVLAGTVLTLPAPASTRYMPIEEVKPGMTGVGRAVFKGTAIEEFRAHILGVLRSSVVGRSAISSSPGSAVVHWPRRESSPA